MLANWCSTGIRLWAKLWGRNRWEPTGRQILQRGPGLYTERQIPSGSPRREFHEGRSRSRPGLIIGRLKDNTQVRQNPVLRGKQGQVTGKETLGQAQSM